MRVLFDLRDHPEYAVFRVANAGLEDHPTYFERYGRVGSGKWWAHYDRGRISRTELVGEVVHVGPKELEPEAGDVVRIRTDRREIAYDREDHWADPAIQVGRWVHIERFQTTGETAQGPITGNVDVRVWVEDD